MSNFWPKELELTTVQTPMEILLEARDEFLRESNNLVFLDFQTENDVNGDEEITVRAVISTTRRSATLFRVVHQIGRPYPSAIVTQENSLPTYLRSTQKKKIRTGGISMLTPPVEREIEETNRWVSIGPAEFRSRLAEVFNSGYVKSTLINSMCNGVHQTT